MVSSTFNTNQTLNVNCIVGLTTIELDNLIAETTAYLNILHPDYGKLAARVAVTKLHKETSDNFFEVIKTLYHYTETDRKIYTANRANYTLGGDASLIADDVYKIIEEN